MSKKSFNETIAAPIPQDKVREIKDLNIEKKVVLAQAIGLYRDVDRVVHYDDETHTVTEDVVELLYDGVHIYVAKAFAGAYQPKDLAYMVGRKFPVLITDLKEVKTEEAEGTIVNTSFVAVASITDAERLIGAQEFRAFSNEKETYTSTKRIGQVVGVVTTKTQEGKETSFAKVMTPEGITAIIHSRVFDYQFTPKPFNERVELGEEVAFNIIKVDKKVIHEDGKNKTVYAYIGNAMKYRQDPLEKLAKHKVGDIFTATVTAIHDIYGVFIDIGLGVTYKGEIAKQTPNKERIKVGTDVVCELKEQHLDGTKITGRAKILNIALS